MSECNTNTCKPQTSECGCPIIQSFENLQCPVETIAKNAPLAFGIAMKESLIESLKVKIKANWGETLDKEADAIVKAMGAHFQATVAQAIAKKTLHEDLCAALSSCKK